MPTAAATSRHVKPVLRSLSISMSSAGCRTATLAGRDPRRLSRLETVDIVQPTRSPTCCSVMPDRYKSTTESGPDPAPDRAARFCSSRRHRVGMPGIAKLSPTPVHTWGGHPNPIADLSPQEALPA